MVFSSWGRLLKLVGEALAANGVRHASLAGANPAQREAALHAFLHDPDCTVLTVGRPRLHAVLRKSRSTVGLLSCWSRTAQPVSPSFATSTHRW